MYCVVIKLAIGRSAVSWLAIAYLVSWFMLVTTLCICPVTFINIILEVCTRGDIHRAFYTEFRCFSQPVAATLVFSTTFETYMLSILIIFLLLGLNTHDPHGNQNIELLV